MNFAGHYLSLHPYQPAVNNAVFRLISLDQQVQLPLRAPFSQFDEIVLLSQLQPIPSFVPYDGNCLFSSICRVLTGEVTDHYVLRSIICQALYTYQVFFFPYDGCASASEYLARLEMFANAKWGGDLEILTFCFLTGCQVFVCDAYLGWIVYSSPFFQNEVSIYLLLQNFHYQPISGHNRIPVFYPIPQVSSKRVPTTPSVNQNCSAFASNSSEISNVRSDVTEQAIYYRRNKDKINQKRRGGKINMQRKLPLLTSGITSERKYANGIKKTKLLQMRKDMKDTKTTMLTGLPRRSEYRKARQGTKIFSKCGNGCPIGSIKQKIVCDH